VAYERHAFEAAAAVAGRVERAAVERAFQPVVAYVSGHDDGVQRALGEKCQHFTFVSVGQGVN
jgi:hypothetical protein